MRISLRLLEEIGMNRADAFRRPALGNLRAELLGEDVQALDFRAEEGSVGGNQPQPRGFQELYP